MGISSETRTNNNQKKQTNTHKHKMFSKFVSLLPAVAFAGKSDMALQFEAITNNASVSQRNLIPILGPQLSQIDEYGCWCYFDGMYSKGRGQPASLVDATCQQLAHGYKCAI